MHTVIKKKNEGVPIGLTVMITVAICNETIINIVLINLSLKSHERHLFLCFPYRIMSCARASYIMLWYTLVKINHDQNAHSYR